jgi:hypothetical protein
MPKRVTRTSGRSSGDLDLSSEHESSDELVRESSDELVRIELSGSQVDRVVREASGAGSLSVLRRELEEGGRGLADALQLDSRQLSRSLLIGLMLLAVFPADGSYLRAADAARRLQLNAGTTRRYASTLLAVGLLERDPVTRGYRRAQ